jgi:hypothetical protein
MTTYTYIFESEDPDADYVTGEVEMLEGVDLTHVKDPCTILLGNPVNGFRVHGIFGSSEEAIHYATEEADLSDVDDWTVATLEPRFTVEPDAQSGRAIEPVPTDPSSVLEAVGRITPDPTVFHRHQPDTPGAKNDLCYGHPNAVTEEIEKLVADLLVGQHGAPYNLFTEGLFYLLVTATRIYTESVMRTKDEAGTSMAQHLVDEQLLDNPHLIGDLAAQFALHLNQTMTAIEENLEGHVPLTDPR